MGKIRLNESDLRKIIAESIRKVMLSEAIDIAKGVPEQFKKAYLKKMIAEYPDLDPNEFFWIKDTLKHSGKKLKKKERIPKPEGMSDIEYITQFIPKYNKRYAKGLSRLLSDSQEGELQWKQLNVSNLRSGDISEKFENRYWICNLGAVTTENPTDVSKCHLSIPYYDSSTKKFQINLRIYDINGNEIDHLCPSAVSLVRNTFGDEVAKELLEIEKVQLRNGSAIMDLENEDY